nr:hypothetical protein [uncultured Pseudomonas sp.]
MSTEFTFPKPNSMTASEAAKWYRAMVPLIPKIKIDDAYGDSDKELRLNEFKTHWMMKYRLRMAAALALYDPEFADEFLQGFPLPSVNECLGSAFAITQDEGAFEWALFELLQISEAEKRKFPGTVGEAIGMECHTSDGIYVMTEEGWAKKD